MARRVGELSDSDQYKLTGSVDPTHLNDDGLTDRPVRLNPLYHP